METILIVEDEEKIVRFLQLELEHEGYRVLQAGDGRKGLALALEEEVDLVLLDLMLPELNGLEVLRRLRQVSDRPVILLTARDQVMDKVTGLDQGANDYITKPFAIEELLARIRACLREQRAPSPATDPPAYQVGPVRLDPGRREVWVGEDQVELTKKEFDLLAYLLANKNLVLDREKLLTQVWGYDFLGETNAVDVYVRYLRAKLDEPYGIKLIHTVRGVGYVIKDEG